MTRRFIILVFFALAGCMAQPTNAKNGVFEVCKNFDNDLDASMDSLFENGWRLADESDATNIAQLNSVALILSAARLSRPNQPDISTPQLRAIAISENATARSAAIATTLAAGNPSQDGTKQSAFLLNRNGTRLVAMFYHSASNSLECYVSGQWTAQDSLDLTGTPIVWAFNNAMGHHSTQNNAPPEVSLSTPIANPITNALFWFYDADQFVNLSEPAIGAVFSAQIVTGY